MTYLTAIRNCFADFRASARQALNVYLDRDGGVDVDLSGEEKAALETELEKLREITKPSELFGVDQVYLEDAGVQAYEQRIVRLSAKIAKVESVQREVVEKEVFAQVQGVVET